VDGVRGIDGSNPSVEPGGAVLWSYVEIAGKPPRFGEFEDVPLDAVEDLPHGGGDSEEGWGRPGRAPAIEENLLARHQTVPMPIAMPYGDTPGDATALDSIEAFGRELFGDLFPMVEKNYRAATCTSRRFT
jgi:enterochelin esterase-like enzyme